MSVLSDNSYMVVSKVYQAFYDSPWKNNEQFDALWSFVQAKKNGVGMFEAGVAILKAFDKYESKTSHQAQVLEELSDEINKELKEMMI